jgi:uncharacterized protein
MGTSLRAQLLKAGLVSEQQVKQAEKQLRQQPRKAPKAAPPRPPSTAARAQAAKAAHDRELNRRKAAKAEAKARAAQIRQIVAQHRLPSVDEGAPFYFQDGAQIRRIYVDAEQRARLTRGELAIARYGSGFALLPPPIAARVRERDPQAVVDIDAAAAGADDDDAYKGFEVPDDLLW